MVLDDEAIKKYNKILDDDSSLDGTQINSILLSLSAKMDKNLDKYVNKKKIDFDDIIPNDEYSLLLQVEDQLPIPQCQYDVLAYIEKKLSEHGRKVHIVDEYNKYIE